MGDILSDEIQSMGATMCLCTGYFNQLGKMKFHLFKSVICSLGGDRAQSLQSITWPPFVPGGTMF